jgi:PadR family transcriptional regulator PadR
MVYEGSSEIQRLLRKNGAECLWPCVLALLNKKPQHAYALQDEIHKQFGFSLGKIIPYRVLYPLETKGFVTSYEKTVDGRKRRYYKLTREGKQLLKEAHDFYAERARDLKP